MPTQSQKSFSLIAGGLFVVYVENQDCQLCSTTRWGWRVTRTSLGATRLGMDTENFLRP